MPIFCAMALKVASGVYILQEGGHWPVWVVAGAVAWSLLTLLVPGLATMLRSPKAIAMFVFWAALTGWYTGLLAFRLVNCVA